MVNGGKAAGFEATGIRPGLAARFLTASRLASYARNPGRLAQAGLFAFAAMRPRRAALPSKLTMGYEMSSKKSRPRVYYSRELAAKICAGLAEGRKLRSICADPGMPDHGTIFRWINAHPEFRELYDAARDDRGGTPYSPQLSDAICDSLSEGRSLRSICAEENMPSLSSIFRWLRQHSEFRAHYNRARNVQADTLFDEMLDIADETRKAWIEREKDAGRAAVGEHIQSAKLRIDTRKYMVGIINRKKYAAKVGLTDDSEAPAVIKVIREIVVPPKKAE